MKTSDFNSARGSLWLRALAGLALMVAAGGVAAQDISGRVFQVTAGSCPRVPIFTNTGEGTLLLQSWDPTDGNLLSSAPLAQSYGDIAMSANGAVIYAARFDDSRMIDRLDPDTGVVFSSFEVSGVFASDGLAFVNGLSVIADGRLLMGTLLNNTIYAVDPATGVSTYFGASFPSGFVSAGDFVTASDGDILAIGASTTNGDFVIFRIKPDLSIFAVGTVSSTFGAATSGGDVYLIGSAGELYRVESIPTVPTMDPLPMTLVSNPGLAFYGATSLQDAGSSCDSAVLTLQKRWANATIGDAITMDARIGGNLIDRLGSTVSTPNQTDTDATPISVFGGDAIAFSESFVTGSAANYSSTLSCVGNSTPLTGNTLVVADADTAITCTFVNTMLLPSVTVAKVLTNESGIRDGVAQPGETLTYTITLANSGGAAFTNYDFVETVPLGATLTSIIGTGVTACATPVVGSGTCNVTVASVPANGSTTVSVVFTVADPIPAGITTIRNLVSGGDTTCATAGNVCEVITPTAGAVSLVKALATESGTQPTIAEPGETLGYTITLTNTGGTAVTGYGVTDRLDTNTSFVSATNGGTHAAGIVSWTNLTIPAQVGATPGTLVLTVTATVAATMPAGVTQIANLAYQTGTTLPACPPAGPQCVVTPTAGQLSVSKSLSAESLVGDGVAQPGEVLTYTITVRNTGGTALTAVLVDEWVPLHTTFVSGTPAWSCAPGAVGGTPCNALVDVAAAIAGGPDVATLSFMVRVADPIPVGVTTLANVVALNDQTPVDCSVNPTAPTCAITPTANIGLVKTVQSVTPTGPGSYSVSYLIEVTNTGGSATTYTLSDTLGFTSSGVSFNGMGLVTSTGGTVNPTLAGGSFSPVNGTVLQISATGVALPAATVHRYTVRVPVAVVPGSVQNAACTGGPGNGFYNAATVTGPVNLSTSTCAPVAVDDVRIRLVKTVLLGVDSNNNHMGDVGDVLHYTFVISNPGTVPLSAIQLIDPRVNDISCGPRTAQGTALTILRGDTIAVHPFEGLGDLAAGDAMTCTATYTLTAADVAARRVVNVATTTGSGPAGQVATSTGTAIFSQFR